MQPAHGTIAIAILVDTPKFGKRYFYAIKKGRLRTAWCLSGARLFPEYGPALTPIVTALDKHRARYEFVRVTTTPIVTAEMVQ